MATFTIKGKAFTTNGDLPEVGTTAPDFKLTNSHLKDKSLASFSGKKKILYTVTSLDTDVCENTTNSFAEVFGQQDNAVLIVVSSDLPFAQIRFLKTNNINNVITLSEMRNRNFAKDYGVLIQDGPLAGLMARTVTVIDDSDTVVYTQWVDEITEAPDYEKAIAAIS